jgi:hypothetical protein
MLLIFTLIQSDLGQFLVSANLNLLLNKFVIKYTIQLFAVIMSVVYWKRDMYPDSNVHAQRFMGNVVIIPSHQLQYLTPCS